MDWRDTPLFDDDGYPTEAVLRDIKEWTCTDPVTGTWNNERLIGLLEHVRALWYYPDYFTDEWKDPDLYDHITEGRVGVYKVSTAGWSGNESLIDAMEKNVLFWHKTWFSTRRGGHYVFRVEFEEGE